MSPRSVLSSMLLLAVASLLCAQSAGNELKTSLTTCIDDSDCMILGEERLYACFKYLCYPWKDDTSVPAKERHNTCHRQSDCTSGESCFRHHDKRNIYRGVCFDDEVTDFCNSSNDCSKGYGCCGGYCCKQHYYSKFKYLPCQSDLGCQDIGLGKFCCPQPFSTSFCCNTDPNSPPSTEPPSQSVTGAGSVAHIRATLLFAMLQALAILV